jgi:phosphatidylserine/phosphatidylglycerophosphate/cardiolipin synthase-like enzyme
MADLEVTFLAERAQPPERVADRLARFIGRARQSLDFAFYDIRLSEGLREAFASALRERAEAGVAIRLAYDADKPEEPLLAQGADPAPSGSGHFVQSLGYPWQRIGGMKLMHHKYIVRDAGTDDACVWTGSTNFTDDAWAIQENNIVELASREIAESYARDFHDLWIDGNFEDSGNFDTRAVPVELDGRRALVHVLFSPGRGEQIDAMVAERVERARQRVRVCSMLLNSGTLLNALLRQLDRGQIPVTGIYDRTQQEGVFNSWREVPSNHWKIGAISEIARRAGLVGKISLPYAPDAPHDYMHNKVLVVDDTVITGSYNFSRSAMKNAENILFIESPALAESYSAYIDRLMERYAPESVPL